MTLRSARQVLESGRARVRRGAGACREALEGWGEQKPPSFRYRFLQYRLCLCLGGREELPAPELRSVSCTLVFRKRRRGGQRCPGLSVSHNILARMMDIKNRELTRSLKDFGAVSCAVTPSTVADSSSDGGAAAAGGGEASSSFGCDLIFLTLGAVSCSETGSCEIFLRLDDIVLYCQCVCLDRY